MFLKVIWGDDMAIMRKIIIAFFTLSLFLIIVDIYSEKELSDVHDIYGLEEDATDLTFTISSKISEVDMEVYLADLIEFADDTNVVLISMKSDYPDDHFTYYYHTQTALDDLIQLPMKERGDSLIYSNHLKGANPLTIMNKNIQVTFLPFSEIYHSENQKYYPVTAYATSKSDLLRFEEAFRAKYQHVIDSVDDMNGDQFDYERNFRNQTTLFFVLGIALFMIMSLFHVSDNLNTISIMKMHGYGFVEITVRLLRKFIIEVVVLEAVTSAALVIYQTVFFGPIPYPLLLDYFYALCLTNLSLASVLAVQLFIINFIRLPMLLKGMNYNHIFQNLALVTKVIMIFFLTPMIAPSVNSLNGTVGAMIELNRGTKELNDTFYVEGLEMEDRFDGYSSMAYLYGKTDEIYEEHKKVYDYFNDQDQLIYQEMTSFGVVNNAQLRDDPIFYQGFNVNRKYFEESGIRDENGDLICLNLDENTVYLLIPESIVDPSNVTQDRILFDPINPVQFITIKDQKTVNYGLPYGHGMYFEEKQLSPYFVVYSDKAFRHNQSIVHGTYLIYDQPIEELKKELEIVSSGKSYILQSSDSAMVNIKKGIVKSAQDFGVLILPGIIVFTILSLSVYVLYYRATVKKRTIHKYMGYTFLASYSVLSFEIIMTHLVPVSILLWRYGASMLSTSLLLFLLDLGCWTYVHHTSESLFKFR